jgi:DHA1 family inner membrane transport protein
VITALVPRDKAAPEAADWRADLRAMLRGPVLFGLLLTVLGFGGVFTVFTYIAPVLTEVSGFPEAMVSPILLVFGGGLVVGNLLGGRLADRNLLWSVLGTLAALGTVMLAMSLALPNPIAAVIAVGLLGAAGFATVAPLQLWVLEKAGGAGTSLASSLNIAAFNLGNALGAWLGGVALEQGLGLTALPLVGAVLPLLALALLLVSLLFRRNAPLATN